ncbi:tail connector protein [Bacteriophage sp.]|nr:tail connector protein [Bacteriophage sp.]
MGNYATLAEVKAQGFNLCDADDATITALLPSASRLVDRLCQVPDDYFAAASDTATDKVIVSEELRFLIVPPHNGSIVAGDITPEYASTDLPDFDDVGFALEARKDECWPDERLTISAKWGFAAIPAEIKQATIELVLQQFRSADPAKARALADAGGQIIDDARIPPRVKETCFHWRRKASYVLV